MLLFKRALVTIVGLWGPFLVGHFVPMNWASGEGFEFAFLLTLTGLGIVFAGNVALSENN